MSIELRNGHVVDYCCASGALGFIGDSLCVGYWWEKPLSVLGFIKPAELTLITKTLTSMPRVGNLKGWCPWRCVRLLPGGNTVNAVGLTNPGLQWWISKCYKRAINKAYNVILSLSPDSVNEAVHMASCVDDYCPDIKGVELNVSCPNVDHDGSVDHVVRIVRAFHKVSKHPIVLKLGVQQPYLEICKELDKTVDAFDLINSVPWNMVYPDHTSPLAKYGLVGGVSGPVIAPFARQVLESVKKSGVKTPVISGGGIMSHDEIKNRSADAFSLGTLFLHRPWRPASIVKQAKDI